MEIVKMVLEKTEMLRFPTKKKKPYSVILSIRSETFEIVCTPVQTENVPGRLDPECIISFSEIKEIRKGKNSKDFESSSHSWECDSAHCFSIFYGTEFRLNSLSLYVHADKRILKNLSESATDENVTRDLVEGLKFLRLHTFSYPQKLHIWIQKVFQSMNVNGEGIHGDSIPLEQMTNHYASRISLQISNESITNLLEKYCKSNGSTLGEFSTGFHEFSGLTIHLLHDQQLFTDCFGKFSLNSTHLKEEGFREFLLHRQKIMNPIIPPEIIKDYFTIVQSDGKLYLDNQKALDFLFSKRNQVWNSEFDKVTHDMSHPLSHYWIASSHNTYLTGDQFSSESSAEAYVQALRGGCRCIEIDCYDGPETPIVYHGRTFTSKISLLIVLKAIWDNAFLASEYPVIISIENHCSLEQQKIMAKMFREIFGKSLVIEPLCEREMKLPSPEALKRRIILKGKKMKTEEEKFGNMLCSVSSSLNTFWRIIKSGMCHKSTLIQTSSTSPVVNPSLATTSSDMSISDAPKTGKMVLRDHGGKWHPYFFALIDKKLHYAAIESQDFSEHDNPDIPMRVKNEPHYKEKWFHGEAACTAAEAARRVLIYNIDGCFLVRMSSRGGEYSLCILYQGQSYNVRIESKLDRSGSGKRLFYIESNKEFHSLCHLILHYRRHSLDTNAFSIARLTVPVPQPPNHETEPWFYKNFDRTKAEQLLANISITGAFLVRYTGLGCTRFVISFRIGKLIKHCRINEDGRLLKVGSMIFENISDLVKYYGTHTFYKWVKLSPSVTTELAAMHRNSGDPIEINTQSGYVETSEVKVRALRDSSSINNPRIQPQLIFKKGDVISNVDKVEVDFWKGDLGNQIQKLFPKDLVEIIEIPGSPFGGCQNGIVDIGDVKVERQADNEFPFLVVISVASGPPFKAAVNSEEEAREWEAAINELREDKPKKRKRHNSKIASELSQLIVYAGSVSKSKSVPEEILRSGCGRLYNKTTSLSESLAEKLTYSNPGSFVWFTQVQLARVYPKGQRIDSSNYNPIPFWNVGAQLVALNYQTPELYMHVNRGKFRQNGNCGYVLKPDFLLKQEFHPNDPKYLITFGIKPLTLKLTILAGRHLYSPEKGIMSPFVDIEIFGASFDCQKIKTRTIPDNGLNPYWNSKFNLEIKNSHLALIRLSVQSEDMFGDPQCIGGITYPVNCLLPGYRSVPLLNGYGDELLAVLLIHLEFEIGE